jgi:DNA-binding LacI/PurR family transcriptional regulator
LPDKAARELQPGEIEEYTVVRVHDEITIDLMKAACGLTYDDVKEDVVIANVGGVPIPFASPKKLWLMKQTYREKDAADRLFLRQLLGDDLPQTPQRPEH